MARRTASPALLATALLVSAILSVAAADRLTTREELYQLAHSHMHMYPWRSAENIHWLEQALRAPFANPLHALARIESEREWEWYRALFTMQIHLSIVRNYLEWAAGFTKHNVYFFNAPYAAQNIESLERADELLSYARVHWDLAVSASNDVASYAWISLPLIQHWEDLHARIRSGDLDYGAIIERHRTRNADARAAFAAMMDRPTQP